MGSIRGAKLNFENYLSKPVNKYINTVNTWLGAFDDGLFKMGQHGASLGEQISILRGNDAARVTCGDAAAVFGTGRDLIGAVRFPAALNKWISGQAIWQTAENDAGVTKWRKVRYEDGAPKVIPKEEIGLNWKKALKTDTEGKSYIDHDGPWINQENPNEKSIDGRYIDDAKGQRIRKDWMDIAMDALIVVGRVLSPIRLLHAIKAINLGKHAKWMGGVVTGIWGAVLTLGFVQSIRDLINELDVGLIRKKIANVIMAFIDWIALPFEFGVGSGVPWLAITGAVLNIISGGCLLFKDAMAYG